MALQKNLAPKQDGDLEKSIKYTKGSFQFQNTGVLGRRSKGKLDANVKGDPDLTYTVTAGDEKAFYARMVELGTAPHAQPENLGGRQHPGAKATPFFYPAYRSLRKRIKSSITRATTKSAKRVAGQ